MPPNDLMEARVIGMLEQAIAHLRAGRRLVPHSKIVEWAVDAEVGDRMKFDLAFQPERKP